MTIQCLFVRALGLFSKVLGLFSEVLGPGRLHPFIDNRKYARSRYRTAAGQSIQAAIGLVNDSANVLLTPA